MRFKQTNVLFKGIILNQFYFPALNSAFRLIQKYLLQFFLLYTVYVDKIMFRLHVKYLPNIFKYKTYFVFKTIVIKSVTCRYYAYGICNQ